MALDLTNFNAPENFDVAAFERGHAAMSEIVPAMDKVKLVVTSEFEEAVQQHEASGSGTYVQDRGAFGVAMAKVLPEGTDESVVIIDSRVLLTGQEPGVPEETFKHEAYHVALKQRGEELHFLGLSEEEGGFAERQYLGMAAIACDEFRVELPLNRERQGSHYESFSDLVASTDRDLRRLSREYEESDHGPDTITAISKGVGEHFHALVTACGYVAAVMEATGSDLPTIDPRLRHRVLGDCGPEVIERLRTLPPADEPAELSELEATAEEVAELLVVWISEIGFRWEDLPNGELFFHVLKPAKWLLAG